MKQKKQIRVAIRHGSARVDENCSPETIEALNKLSELAFKLTVKEIEEKKNGRPEI